MLIYPDSSIIFLRSFTRPAHVILTVTEGDGKERTVWPSLSVKWYSARQRSKWKCINRPHTCWKRRGRPSSWKT